MSKPKSKYSIFNLLALCQSYTNCTPSPSNGNKVADVSDICEEIDRLYETALEAEGDLDLFEIKPGEQRDILYIGKGVIRVKASLPEPKILDDGFAMSYDHLHKASAQINNEIKAYDKAIGSFKPGTGNYKTDTNYSSSADKPSFLWPDISSMIKHDKQMLEEIRSEKEKEITYLKWKLDQVQSDNAKLEEERDKFKKLCRQKDDMIVGLNKRCDDITQSNNANYERKEEAIKRVNELSKLYLDALVRISNQQAEYEELQGQHKSQKKTIEEFQSWRDTVRNLAGLAITKDSFGINYHSVPIMDLVDFINRKP